MKDYHHLSMWQRSMDFVVKTYKLTAELPVDEKYGLSSQIRRAAVSIPANIAEGCGRDSINEFSHFLSIAIGSACEVECELGIVQQLGMADTEKITTLLNDVKEIKSMIDVYKNKLKKTSTK